MTYNSYQHVRRYQLRLWLKRIAIIAGLFLVIAGPTTYFLTTHPKQSEAAWYNESWKFRKKITVDDTKVSGSADLTNFPILVKFTSEPDLAAKAQSDGDDILFTDSTGTKLDHEIETYTTATGALVAWVEVPTLKGAAVTELFMYYGNPSVSSQQNASGTWNSAYTGVWHVKETPTGSANDVADSTSNSVHTTSTAMDSTNQVAGMDNGSLLFDGSTEYTSRTTVPQTSTTNYTIQAWVKLSAITQLSIAVYNGNDGGGYGFGVGNGGGAAGSVLSGLNGNVAWLNSSYTFAATDTWYHIVMTRDTTTTRFYVDGSQTAGTSASTPLTPTSRFSIGQEFNGSNVASRFFSGTVDEVRISNTNRSADWIATEYNNQSSPSTFFTLGTQTASPTVLYWAFNENQGTTTNDTSNNGNSGTITNAVWESNGKSNSPGDSALSFDGSGDRVARTYSGDTELDPGTGSLSVSMWAKHSSTAPSGGTSDVLLSRYNTSGYKIYMYTGGTICFGIDANSTWDNPDSTCSTLSYADSQWHHVEAVKNGTTSITLYIDGRQVGTPDTSIISSTISGTSPTLYVGIDDDGTSQSWEGLLDDVKIYQTARTADEVKSDYNAKGSVAGSAATFGANSINAGTALTQGLVGWWKMDESSWTVNCSTTSVTDSSGNANSGKACPNSTGPAGGATGKFNRGGSFDGSNDYVEVADSNSLDVSSALTLSAWIKATSLGGRIIDKITASGTNGYLLDTFGSKLRFCASSCLSSTTTPSTGTWIHVVATYDGTTTRLYLNGVLDASSTAITSVPTNALVLRLGADSNASSIFSGTMDEVRIYNRALSDKDVRDLYSWAPGPVGYWKLDERTGTSASDTSGSGYTGTLTNTPIWAAGKYGSSVNFTSTSSQYITAGDVNELDSATTFTLSAWMKRKAANSEIDISKDTDAQHTVGLELYSDGHFYPVVSNSGSQTYGDAGTFNDTNWHYYTMVYDGTQSTDATKLKAYVDGVQQTLTFTGSMPSSTANHTGNFEIGRARYASLYADGNVDDVKIYNYPRSTKQIVEDMNANHPAGGSTGGMMKAHWKMDEMTGQILNDSSGNANNGTLGDTSGSSSDDPAWGAGKYNGGLVMDTGGEFADGVTATLLGFPDATKAFSISLWVKTTGSSEYYLFDNCNSCGRDVSLRMDNGKVETLIHDGTNSNGTPQYGTASSYNNGAWHYIALTWNGAGLETVYADGIKLGSTTSTSITGSLETSTQFRIGTRNGGPNNFTGSMDEVKVYNYDLNLDEIMVDYNQGKAAVLGSVSTESDGTTASFANSRQYCIPGDTTSCSTPRIELRLDERTGTTANDTSGNGLDGTLTNGPTWSNGKIGSGVTFDGSDDYIAVSDTTDPTAYTMEAWVKPTDVTSTSIFVRTDSSGPAAAWSHQLRITSASKFEAYAFDGASQSVIGTTTVVAGTWYHVVATAANSGNLRLFVNGIEEGTADTIGTLWTGGDRYRIGSNSGDSMGFYSGIIDQVMLYDYARTRAQVAWDYNRGGPVAWYKFDECTGDTAYDSSGNGLNATLSYASGTNTAAGTCTSGSTSEMRYNGRNGKMNSALDFDGTTDYYQAADNNALDIGSQMTFTGWFKVTDTATDRPIISKVNEYLIRFNSDDTFSFYLYDGASYEPRLNAAVNPSAGEWHHFAAVYDSTLGSNQQKLYIDGRLSAQQTRSFTPTATTNVLSNNFFGAVFQGLIDDIRIYRYPLTSAQIQLVMNDNAAVRFAPLTGTP